LDGIEVMERLSTNLEGDYLPVLVLTAQTDMETRMRALEAGARDFLTKPFNHFEVLLRVRNLLETRYYFNGLRDRGDVLERRVRERTREVRETQLEVVRRLGRAGEYRDNETGAHVIRMSQSCQLVALKLGFNEDYADELLHATPMHDVGKIGIPDSILLKPGKLDPDEWEIMKTHTTIGGEIIGDHASEVLRLAKVIALTHHENWDGSGYPSGLKGTDIPVEARIASVCDIFDALTSERPYKKAWPVNDAMAFLDEQAGIKIDPDVLAAFRDVLPDVLAFRELFPDEE